ncbi:hypothetical protein J2128_002310 [Methanomicrobium sp. W14]|uniref:hypothetical protein n=1 Tax=Methanomicrobium sp. W14 TaxID=2817839 RepID=UPI001AEA2F35|nr:hypothetical protein [Methanomicrobium sp. W14]MBP2134344.1 hypothetical protein [Methanomicrobium sp. W14]
MTTYNDIYIRDNFGDTGVIPSTGIPYQSPDIIPFQDKTLTWDKANSSYKGPHIGKSIINNGVNNIYVRAKNLGDKEVSGSTVSLYYSKASLFLLPVKWTSVMSAGGKKALSFVDGSGSNSISPGGVAVSNPSFFLTGLPPVSRTHYCLIGIVQTPDHPVTIPAAFTSNAAYDKWVMNNPAVAYRNISYSPNTKTQVSRVFDFGNVNQSSAYFTIIITGHGFVPGTAVRSQCTDVNCPIDNNASLPEGDPQGNQNASFVTSVPGNFSGNLVVTVTSPEGNFPAGASLTISYFQIPDKSNALDMAVARRFALAENADLKVPKLIRLGECRLNITGDPALAED